MEILRKTSSRIDVLMRWYRCFYAFQYLRGELLNNFDKTNIDYQIASSFIEQTAVARKWQRFAEMKV